MYTVFCRMNFDLAEMVETGREKRINENKLRWVKKNTLVSSSVQVKSCLVDVEFWSARWSHHLFPPGKTLTFQCSFLTRIVSFSGIILLFVTLVFQYIDTSVIYHVVRVQSVIKLYVVYNMLDVCIIWRSFTAVSQSFEGKY